MTDSLEIKLKNFLNLYWLRPENGLITTFKSKAFEDLKFESPSLDLSCGDGLFMAIHLGAVFDDDFDYFKSTKAKEFSHDKMVDIYDDFNENYNVDFIKKPKIKIDYGSDWKQALLNKAEKLDLYKNLVLHDNNQLPLPFEDNYFKTIYSNSVYWVKQPEKLVEDIYRITSPGGMCSLEVLTPNRYEILNQLTKLAYLEAGQQLKGRNWFEQLWKKIPIQEQKECIKNESRKREDVCNRWHNENS